MFLSQKPSLSLWFVSVCPFEQHFSTPQSSWTEPSRVQSTAVCYRRSFSPPDKHVIKSLCSGIHHRFQHVTVRCAAIRGFIVHPASQRQFGRAYFSCHDSEWKGARWADELTRKAVKCTSQRAWNSLQHLSRWHTSTCLAVPVWCSGAGLIHKTDQTLD